MLLLRVGAGVTRGMWLFWSLWFGSALGLLLWIWPLGGSLRSTLVLAYLGPLVSLVVHEYAHARAAIMLGARGVRLERSGPTVAVTHESLGVVHDRVVAAVGPLASLIGGLFCLLAGSLVDSAGVAVFGATVGAGALSLLPGTEDGRRIWCRLNSATPESGELRGASRPG